MKQARTCDGTRAGNGPTARLLREAASLTLLARGATAPLAPILLAADLRERLLVIEDIADAPDLRTVLQGTSAAAAEAALLDLARLLGRLHGTGARLADAHARIHASLPLLQIPYSKAFRGVLIPGSFSTIVNRACMLAGTSPAVSIGADLEVLWRFARSPARFRTTLHGDICPDNVLLTAAGPRLIDFEFGAPGHAFADAVFARLGFPACWCSGRLPEPLLERVEASYRRELALLDLLASDDCSYHTAQVEGCAFWALGTLSWALSRAVVGDEGWGECRLRHRILMQLEAAAQLSTSHAHLERLGTVYAGLAEALRARWRMPNVVTPFFKAFCADAEDPHVIS